MESLFVDLLMFLFTKHRRLVFTSFNAEQYFKAVHQLKNNGVSYRSKLTNPGTGSEYVSRHNMTQYDIYVRKEDVHLAERAINMRE